MKEGASWKGKIDNAKPWQKKMENIISADT